MLKPTCDVSIEGLKFGPIAVAVATRRLNQ